MKRALFFTAVTLLFITNAYGQKPMPTTTGENSFLMAIEDVFYISGRGTVATGTIERGRLKVGDTVEIVGIKPTLTTTVVMIDEAGKMLTETGTGATVGILLKDVEKTDVHRGQVLAKPGSVKAFTKFRARIDMLRPAEGGRSAPFTTGYRPQIYIRTGSFSGVMTLSEGKQAVSPGEKGVEVDIVISRSAALENGQTITFREAGRTIGTGLITSREK
jgi:elongation factor Tu